MIKRLVWAGGILATVIVLASAGLAAYVASSWDRVYEAPLPDVRISTDPAVLARGEYLVYGPAHCVECHGGSFDALEKLSEGVQVPLRGGLRLVLGPLGAVLSNLLRTRRRDWLLLRRANRPDDALGGAARRPRHGGATNAVRQPGRGRPR